MATALFASPARAAARAALSCALCAFRHVWSCGASKRAGGCPGPCAVHPDVKGTQLICPSFCGTGLCFCSCAQQRKQIGGQLQPAPGLIALSLVALCP